MKKGIYFITISLFILVVFLVIFYVISATEESETQTSIAYRIQLMNDFLTDFENDAPRAMFVASFRSFIALEENVFNTGEYYPDIQTSFSEVFVNGTINGTQFTIMNDSSLKDYLQKVNLIANNIGINMDFQLNNVEIYHITPWQLSVEINGTINLTDNTGVASWLYDTSIAANIPIQDLRDPLYTVGANGKLPSPVKRWDTSQFFVNSSNNNTDNLQEFMNGTYYIENPDAPNFLMRFQGQTGNDTNGIESLVNLRILGDQSVDILTGKSVVDHIYFSNETTTNYCNIDGMIFNPDWFVLDSNHTSFYEVDNLTKSLC